MATRNLNKVILIGNLTRDPEIRYTPQGNAVASFVIATNREWNTAGEKKQAVDFHNAVAWNKLAEIVGQLLKKGTKVYVEGRLQTRNWMDAQGTKRYKTEVVVDDMIVLSPKKQESTEVEEGFEEDVEKQSPEFASPEEDLDLGDLDLDLADTQPKTENK